MTSTIDNLYIHSFNVVYTTDPNTELHSFPLIFPETVLVPANSLLNIDMKLRVNLFCPYIPAFSCAAIVSPDVSLINTPLIYALPGFPIYDDGYATDLFIPVRNLSSNDYEIIAGTILFNIHASSGDKFTVIEVPTEHVSMITRVV